MEFIESERGNQKQNIKLKKICGGQLSGGLLSCSHFKVFGLTRPGLEPTIYRTQGKHANHYTTIVFETLIDWNHLENTFKWAQAFCERHFFLRNHSLCFTIKYHIVHTFLIWVFMLKVTL
jgi:hypothetical protein